MKYFLSILHVLQIWQKCFKPFFSKQVLPIETNVMMVTALLAAIHTEKDLVGSQGWSDILNFSSRRVVFCAESTEQGCLTISHFRESSNSAKFPRQSTSPHVTSNVTWILSDTI